MDTIHGQDVSNDIIANNLNRIGGQIFRLLPSREEGKDWVKPLETLIIELSGMSSLLPRQETLFSLVCKLQGLKDAGEEVDFMLFRRTIFEACSMVSEVKNNVVW